MLTLRRLLLSAAPIAVASLAIAVVASDGHAAPRKKKRTTTTQGAPAQRAEPPASGGATDRGAPAPHRRRRGAHGSTATPPPSEPTGGATRHVARGNSPRHAVREGLLPPAVENASCPFEMASIDGRFCVDRWEAALLEVLPNGGEREWSPFEQITPGTSVRAISAPGIVPQAYISGEQAQAACQASGKRLCNPTEWRTACMGPRHQTWGYGSAHVANRCNDHGSSPMYHYFPQVKVSWRTVGMVEMNDPRLNQFDGTLMRTGTNPDCTNDYGVYDMVGNLHEWTDDPNGTFQGGWYLDTSINGDGCQYRTNVHEFRYHDYSTGFRCCADAHAAPPPGDQGPDIPGATNATATTIATPRPIPTTPAPARPASDPYGGL